MTPDERKQFEEMRKQLQLLTRCEDVSFVETMKTRLGLRSLILTLIGETNLGSLANVDDTGITNAQVLKWNSSSEMYEPAADNT